MARKKVEFDAHKIGKVSTKVSFDTKEGQKVRFGADKREKGSGSRNVYDKEVTAEFHGASRKDKSGIRGEAQVRRAPARGGGFRPHAQNSARARNWKACAKSSSALADRINSTTVGCSNRRC